MLKERIKICYSPLLQGLPGIIHGFTGRNNNVSYNSKNQPHFFESLGIVFERLVFLEQVHGSKINIVNNSNTGQRYSGFDGHVYLKKKFAEISPVLCIKSADCAPVLFCDIRKNIIGAVHSGWKGTILNISNLMIDKMLDMGSVLNDIYVAIGPSIKSCCYSVDENRMKKFAKYYPKNSSVIVKREGKWYVDIGNAIFNQLINKGIISSQISQSDVCTSCNNDRFFSYRSDQVASKGVNISYIGFL
jgi:polyphenol oxidase